MKSRTPRQAGAARPDGDARLERKTFACEVKAEGEDGSFELYAAAYGNEDRQGDVIAPGAVRNLEELVRDGWGALNHRAFDLPVAYAESASQDARGLLIRGRFHSHAEAQACRTVVRERRAAGKRVLCSIGYVVDDATTEVRDGNPVRVLKAIRVYEFSFVNLPANPEASLVSAKSAGDAASLNRAGVSHARALIRAGRVAAGKWGFTAADAHALLGDDGDDWATFGKCHLAVDPDVPDDEEGHWKYPFAKRDGDGDGDIRVYLGGLRAIASRAAQQGKTDISDAASRLLKEAGEDDVSDGNEKGSILLAVKRLLGIAAKSGAAISRANREKIKGCAQAMIAHHEAGLEKCAVLHKGLKALKEHHEEGARIGEALDEFADSHEPDVDDEDGPPRRRGARKDEEPEDTADGEPPKGLDREAIALKLAALPRPA